MTLTTPRTARHRTGFVRDAYGNAAAETFLIIAIATILVTRTYLAITDYPQVGVVHCISRTPSTAVPQ